MRIKQLEFSFYSRYNPPPSTAVDVGATSLTHKECAKECDINYVMSRYSQTGVLPSGNRLPLDGALMDAIGTDFQESMDSLIRAREEFESLPSKLRDRFGNDPAKLVAFLSDESNRAEAITLGLIPDRVRDPDPQPAPQNAGVVESGTRDVKS